jgi:hypothetical protein
MKHVSTALRIRETVLKKPGSLEHRTQRNNPHLFPTARACTAAALEHPAHMRHTDGAVRVQLDDARHACERGGARRRVRGGAPVDPQRLTAREAVERRSGRRCDRSKP